MPTASLFDTVGTWKGERESKRREREERGVEGTNRQKERDSERETERERENVIQPDTVVIKARGRVRLQSELTSRGGQWRPSKGAGQRGEGRNTDQLCVLREASRELDHSLE